MTEKSLSGQGGSEYPRPKPVDALEITILMDNYVDLILDDMGPLKRPTDQQTLGADTLFAEHGLSLWVTTRRGGEEHHLLLDAGYNPRGVLHNMGLLGKDPGLLEAMVLSHGHMDHTGGVKNILGRTKNPIPLAAHDDAFLERAFKRPDGTITTAPPPLNRAELEELGAKIILASKPLTIAGDTVLVTGPVPRRTDFEKGMPGAIIKRDSGWEEDLIKDDMAIVVDLGAKGLALISGCAHSGIVNTLDWTADIFGRQDFALVMGGFHLSGALMAKAVAPTIEGLKRYSPGLVMPFHCTGWHSTQAIAQVFGDRFLLSSVGSKLIL